MASKTPPQPPTRSPFSVAGWLGLSEVWKEGHTYSFYSVATDNVGHRQPTPSVPQAVTTIADRTPPTLDNMPPDQTVEATSAAGALVSFQLPTATDAGDPNPTVSCTPSSGSTFPLDGGSTFPVGTIEVQCSASDAHGNSATLGFSVTVQDTTPPALSLPSDITAQATGASGAIVSYSATASDLVDGSVSVNCSPTSGSTFAIGTTTVNCSAADSHGNNADGNFKVTVQDTLALTIDKLELVPDRKRKKITQIVLTFSEPLNESLARSLGNYNLRTVAKRPKLVPIATVAYVSGSRLVTLTLAKPLPTKKLCKFALTVDGLTDVDGNLLDGDANGIPGGVYRHLLCEGTIRPAAPAIHSAIDVLLSSGIDAASLRLEGLVEKELHG